MQFVGDDVLGRHEEAGVVLELVIQSATGTDDSLDDDCPDFESPLKDQVEFGVYAGNSVERQSPEGRVDHVELVSVVQQEPDDYVVKRVDTVDGVVDVFGADSHQSEDALSPLQLVEFRLRHTLGALWSPVGAPS